MQIRTKKTEYIILAIILLVGLFLRGSYLLEIIKYPDFDYPVTDAALNDHWARGIADDDWSVKKENDPEIRSTPYFQPPGYAYFLSMIYQSSGSSYLAVRIVQMVLGLFNCILAYLLGRSMFGRATGLIFAGLMSVYWIFIYFEGELLAPSLVNFGSLILMHALFLWVNKFSYARGIAAGITIGMLALVRSNVLLFIPVVLVWAWWLSRRKKDGRRLHTVAIGFLAGCLLTICPVTIRNYRVADDFVLISSNAGINLYIGNNEKAKGNAPYIPDVIELTGSDSWSCFSYPLVARGIEKLEGREMKHSEVSSYFTARALDYIRSNPGKTLKLTLKKILLFWGPAEMPNNKELGCGKIQSATLRFLPGFSAAAASGAIGLLMLIFSLRQKQTDSKTSDDHRQRQQETSVLVVLFIACYFASYVPFFIVARFRVAIIPFLLLFGAYGIFRIYQYIANHNTKKAVCWLLAGICLFLLGRIQIIPYSPDWARWHYDRGYVYLHKEQFAQAIEECRKAVDINPYDPFARNKLGKVLAKCDKLPEAITHYSEALKIKPDFMNARIGLANMYHKQKQYDLALENLFIALKMNPEFTKIHICLGDTFLQTKQYDQAIKWWIKAIQVQSESSELLSDLANAYYKQKDFKKSLTYVQKSLNINQQQPAMLNQLAALYNKQRRADKVIECFNKSLQIAPKQPTIMSELAMALYGQSKVQEAIALWSDSLAIDPNQVYTANSLGWIKATSKDEKFYNPVEALKFARLACELTKYQNPGMLDTLAASLAANGQFDKAAETIGQAIEIAKSTDQNELVPDFQKHLNLYKNQKALRE